MCTWNNTTLPTWTSISAFPPLHCSYTACLPPQVNQSFLLCVWWFSKKQTTPWQYNSGDEHYTGPSKIRQYFYSASLLRNWIMESLRRHLIIGRSRMARIEFALFRFWSRNPCIPANWLSKRASTLRLQGCGFDAWTGHSKDDKNGNCLIAWHSSWTVGLGGLYDQGIPDNGNAAAHCSNSVVKCGGKSFVSFGMWQSAGLFWLFFTLVSTAFSALFHTQSLFLHG